MHEYEPIYFPWVFSVWYEYEIFIILLKQKTVLSLNQYWIFINVVLEKVFSFYNSSNTPSVKETQTDGRTWRKHPCKRWLI